MSGKKVLVTGGHGNLGSYITKELAQSCYDVYVLTINSKNKIDDIDYKIIEADITDLESLHQKLDFEIDYCVHTASFNEFFLPEYPKKALDINTLGTRNLLEVLSKKNIKNFIYFSTFHVYGLNSGIITEENYLNPKNDYASTHLFAEFYVKQFGYTNNLKYTILRLTNSYGVPTFIDSDKWYLVLNDLVKMAFENQKVVLHSNGKAKRDFIYMGDVAIIVDKLLRIDATNDIFNVSSSQIYEIIELANIVKNVFKVRYKKTIEIQINQHDKLIYETLEVKNEKLKSLIDFTINDVIQQEINKIFDLLEQNSEK